MEPVDITAIAPAAAEQWRKQFGDRRATGNRLYHWWPGIAGWQGPECKP